MSLSFKALAAQSFTLNYSTTTQVICNRHAFAYKCLGSRKRLTRFNPDGINSYEMNNQPKKSTFKYKQEGRLYIGVANIKNKYRTIKRKYCPLFNYTDKKNITIDACKKEILNEFARIRKLTFSSSPWAEIFKLTRYGYVNQ